MSMADLLGSDLESDEEDQDGNYAGQQSDQESEAENSGSEGDHSPRRSPSNGSEVAAGSDGDVAAGSDGDVAAGSDGEVAADNDNKGELVEDDGEVAAGSEDEAAGSEGEVAAGGKVVTGSDDEMAAGSDGEGAAGSEVAAVSDGEGEMAAGSDGEVAAGSDDEGEVAAGSDGEGEVAAGSDGEVAAGSDGEVEADNDGQAAAGSDGEVAAGSNGEMAAGSDGEFAGGSDGEAEVITDSKGEVVARSDGEDEMVAGSDNEGNIQEEKVKSEMENKVEVEELPSTQSQMNDLFGDSDDDEAKDTGNGDIVFDKDLFDQEMDDDEQQTDMNEENDENNKVEKSPPAAPTQADIFGEDLDVSSDEDDADAEPPSKETEEDQIDEEIRGDLEQLERQDTIVGEDGEEQPAPEEGVAIEIELPKYDVPLGNELYFIKLPNFLSVETKPFEPALYEDEIDEDDVLDDEGRSRLKLKVENTIRWRQAKDEDDNSYKESNARVVRWSDGSLSMHLGNEIFDIFKMPVQGEQNHLFVQQGTGLQAKAVFKEKLTFRPHSTKSQTHRKMTMSIADRMAKTNRVRVLPATEKDPESHREEMCKKEEERMRAQVRREATQRRMREKSHSKGLTANYLESDMFEDDEQELEESLAAIKNRYKKDVKAGRSRDIKDQIYSDDDDDDDDDDDSDVDKKKSVTKDSDDEEGPFASKRKSTGGTEPAIKKKSRKIIESDESDDDDDDDD